MRFLRQDIVSDDEIGQIDTFDIGFFGSADLDDRTRHSVQLTKAAARISLPARYDPEKFTLTVGDRIFRVDGLDELFTTYRARSIVLDATSLEFPELLYLLRAYCLQQQRPRCGFFYVEPKGYAQRDSEESIVPGNAFDLSTGFKGRSHLPLFSRMLSETHRAHLVAFLGFEGDRLRRVLDADDGHFYRRVSIVFGVPPFQPNWDLHAVMANSSLLELSHANVAYCGANNPMAAYQLLKDAHIAIESGRGLNRLCVAPFGTKPMAIGSALYCLDNDIYTPIYDYPVRRANRTHGVHRRHWYEIDLSM